METNSTFNNEQFERPQQSAPESVPNLKMAALAYVVFFFPFFTKARNDQFVRYHMRQGLALLITCIILQVIGYVSFMSWLFFWPMLIVVLLLLALGVYNSLKGQQKPLPIIGEWAEGLNF